jgi:hypothetical protein
MTTIVDEELTRKESLLIKKIDAFSDAAYQLSLAWEKLQQEDHEIYAFSDKYPFHMSFDEMCWEISEWRLKMYYEIKQIRKNRWK